jgi:hypothetical protein
LSLGTELFGLALMHPRLFLLALVGSMWAVHQVVQEKFMGGINSTSKGCKVEHASGKKFL